ncbi:sugar ABC transporter permease [Streptomyces sp. NPDC051940]|uniref:carbohydrate ABC transporter permease n=1 Tax=Streptomyces sp. NPDC051940 TaxID=3155675 RepID=UPI0034348EB2
MSQLAPLRRPATARPPAAVAPKTRSRAPGGPLDQARARLFWPFLGPALGLYVLLFIVPALFSVAVSLTRWSGPGTSAQWRGLDNYVRLFGDPVFLRSFRNTLVLLGLGAVLVGAVTALSMVVLRRTRGRRFLRAVVFFPVIVSPIAVGTAVGFILDPRGLLNQGLGTIGLQALEQTWLAPDMVMWCIVATLAWASGGFYVALLMSAVDAVPQELYEQAQIDGTTRWEQFLHVTWPGCREMASVAAVLCLVNLLKVFDLVYAFTGTTGNPPIEARTLSVQQFLTVSGEGSVPDLGYGSAMAVFLVVVAGVLLIVMHRFPGRQEER